MATRADQLPALSGSIPDTQLVLVPDPITGELFRTTFGQVKADIIIAVGDLSYLDDVIEVPTVAALPNPGEVKKIYVITTGADANKQFRWGGSIYIEFPQGSGDVAGEAIIRGNADLALGQRIDDEITDRGNADNTLQTNITNEITARQNANSTLANLLAAETNNRQNADGTLQSLINGEGVTRANADSALQNQINDLDNHFRGKFTSIAALEAALPTAEIGDYAQVDEGAGHDVVNYNWDEQDGWVKGGSGSGATSTDELTEGSNNLYFKTSRVLTTVLTNLTAAAGALSSTDTILQAFGKIKKLITDFLTSFNGANQLVKLDGDGKLPAIDGSELTNLPTGGGAWGGIGGTLSDQTDLQYSLGQKQGKNVYGESIDPTTFNVGGSAVTLAQDIVYIDITVVPNLQYRFDGSVLVSIGAAGGGGDNYATATGTNTYTAAIAGITTYSEGMSIRIKFTNGNTGNSTININSLGAKTIYRLANVALLSGAIQAGMVIELYYDGTAFQMNTPSVVPTGINKAVTTNGSGVMETTYDLTDIIVGSVSDSGGVKTSIQMASLFPTVGAGQKAIGADGFYMYVGISGWFYFENAIPV